jgi:hypothetical protein
MMKFPSIMDTDDIDELTEVLVNPTIPETEEMLEVAPDIAYQPAPESPPPYAVDASEFYVSEPERIELPPFLASRLERFPLTKSQWILIGTMAFFEFIIILILFALVIVNTFFT